MTEPEIWFQMGISDERHAIAAREIASILKTKEPIGTMMLMVQDSTVLMNNEKQYAAFMIAKEDIKRRLAKAMPNFAAGLLKPLMED